MYDIHDLFHACETGDIKRAEAFLEANNVGVDTQDSDDLTALQVAAANDQVTAKLNEIQTWRICLLKMARDHIRRSLMVSCARFHNAVVIIRNYH